MGRIEQALHRAERTRAADRSLRTSGLREIAIEHMDGEARGFSRRFRQHSILIGRGEHNDVPFDPFDDPTVSTQHAEIRIEGQDVLLYDMGSLNGSFIANERVRRIQLEDGTELRLGRAGPRLKISLGDSLTAAAPAEPPRIRSSSTPSHAQPETAESPALGTRQFAPLETWLLAGLLLAVVVDGAISLMR